MVNGGADAGPGRRNPSEISGISAVVKFAVRKRVAGIEARVIGKVIIVPSRPAQRALLAIRPKVSPIDLIGNQRQRGVPTRCTHAHDSGKSVRTVKYTIWTAHN